MYVVHLVFFTDGLEKFDDFNSQGYFDYVITTNLNYRSPELLKRSWYIEADMSKFTAAIINTFNHDVPIETAYLNRKDSDIAKEAQRTI